jgi:3-oxoacyl-[acyl-carrier protein] reductase
MIFQDALDYAGKTVLVVGGSSGIGNGIAQAFLAHGAEVHVWGTRPSAEDYSPGEGSDLAGLRYARVDMTDIDGISALKPAFSALDVLVCCQGTVIYKRGEYAMDGFQKVIDVNLNSVMACALKFHSLLKATGGSITIVSSTGQFKAVRGNPAYGASKAACGGLVRSLADAWASDGIRVNGLAPGLVATKLTTVTTEHPERLAASLKAIPMRRLGTPDDMAGVALFLASPLAAYVCGHTIPVDGGELL